MPVNRYKQPPAYFFSNVSVMGGQPVATFQYTNSVMETDSEGRTAFVTYYRIDLSSLVTRIINLGKPENYGKSFPDMSEDLKGLQALVMHPMNRNSLLAAERVSKELSRLIHNMI